MRALMTALVAVALFTGGAGPSHAQDFEVDLSRCQEQLEAFARLQLDCPVAVTPTEAGLERVPEMLRQLLSGLTCSTRLTANKADVYGKWITSGRFDPPRKQITCQHPQINNQRLVATVDVTCKREGDGSNGRWSCPPGVEKVEGAGFLGQYLTQYLNQGSGLWSELEEELAERD